MRIVIISCYAAILILPKRLKTELKSDTTIKKLLKKSAKLTIATVEPSYLGHSRSLTYSIKKPMYTTSY